MLVLKKTKDMVTVAAPAYVADDREETPGACVFSVSIEQIRDMRSAGEAVRQYGFDVLKRDGEARWVDLCDDVATLSEEPDPAGWEDIEGVVGCKIGYYRDEDEIEVTAFYEKTTVDIYTGGISLAEIEAAIRKKEVAGGAQ